jgi:1-acyl-sn-glycerol-3-phosphate acyltransferase
MWARRLVTIPSLVLAWGVLVATFPLTSLLAIGVGLVRRRRFVEARMLVFVVVYTSLELVGLARALTLVVMPVGPRRSARHVTLQAWWASTLFAVARALLGLRLDVSGGDSVARGPLILALRHASLADSLLPAVLVTRPHGIALRYVLKKELLVDPCLDVVGHRLPNHFVDRARPTEADLNAIAALATDLGPHDGAILYPEGTRFTPKKKARVLAEMEAKGASQLERARTLRHTLPPRVGGLFAMIDAAPDVDVVFGAHVGFEGFATFADLFSGAMVGRELRVRFWRVPAAEVPREREARKAWLFDQWQKIDDFVASASVDESVDESASSAESRGTEPTPPARSETPLGSSPHRR